ncbi:hypothetical protein P6U16_24870 (plasmid) [Rhizobium sp. 32-5/1]|uniref:hypothetical protein n=1 Tax=Rhizobium sp. 32-5/1 TaxID=3019602 RepID=UPI00240E0CE4|nr:hypothetical protein [Rhizobium sp. 32-5/1]WEZ85368.1 hypothetical protein P6U16_24870 [Rhizobium sp. 32-5/1]
MSVTVVVSIKGTSVEKIREVASARPDLSQALGTLLKKHGVISHKRYYNGDDILDIDEWESEEGFQNFLTEARPLIDELARLRGSEIPTDRVWFPL